jgi:Trk K+ transport system NAD-binding subunit
MTMTRRFMVIGIGVVADSIITRLSQDGFTVCAVARGERLARPAACRC